MRDTATTTIEDRTLEIAGMTCGSCQRHVEDALAAVPGVREAAVDLARGTAHVRFDPSAASLGALTEAVRRAGYGVGMPTHRIPRREGGGGCGCGCG